MLETSARYSRRGGGDEWDVRLRAGEVRRGSGMVLLLLLLLLEEEEQEAGQEQDSGGAFQRKWVLMGSGEVRGGDVVGVRRPIWEVDGWRVGVEWKVLDGG